MLQKSKSSKLSKLRFLLIIPLMLAMLTYVACSEDIDSDETDLDQYSYSVQKGENLYDGSQKSQTHAKYEEFLFNNPEYVSWASIDYKSERVNYTIHPEAEKVPQGYRKMEVSSPDGKSYTMYMNLKAPGEAAQQAEQEQARQFNEQAQKDMGNGDGVPYAVIEKVPAFQNCAALEGEERKTCTSREISMFVNKNFDTSLGKKLGLTGINRVIVQFRIDETGKVRDIKSRAPHPKLEEEAKRVIASLPDFIPGEQKGRPVNVMYSLPIAFKVSE